MAIASQSLINLSVASDQGGNQTLLMPKLQYRFRVNFFNFGLSDATQLTRQVVDVSRPNISFAKITMPVYNSTIFMAGKHTWATLSCNLRDDASGLVSRVVGEQLQKQLDFMEQSSAASASDYKFTMGLDILDGGNGTAAPGVLEAWELYGCYLESVNYNTLNYGTSEDIKIALTIQYDNAVQLDGVGTTGPGTRNATATATNVAGGGGV